MKDSPPRRPCVLTIAGFDPSCGAGIAADLKTITACGCYATAVVSALTIQNTLGVKRVVPVQPSNLTDQLRCVVDDIFPSAVKIGMLATRENVAALASFLRSTSLLNVVLDPVLQSTSGMPLLSTDALELLKSGLVTQVDCLTPNIDEAGILAGLKIKNVDEMKNAAARIVGMGAKAVVITGGHLEMATDVLFDGNDFVIFSERRIESQGVHGTGCTFASALAAYLARGRSLHDAVAEAKRFVTKAIIHSQSLGRGNRLLEHFFE